MEQIPGTSFTSKKLSSSFLPLQSELLSIKWKPVESRDGSADPLLEYEIVRLVYHCPPHFDLQVEELYGLTEDELTVAVPVGR